MKSPIPRCTQHNSVYLGMKSSYCDIPSISQYEDFIPRYTELSRWSGFQMVTARAAATRRWLIWILARYDIVRLRTMSYVHPTTSYVRRTMSGSTSHVRHRTYDITYDIARTTSYVCQHRRCDIRHRTSDVRYRRFRKIYVVYDVVCQPKPTMSYVWKCISYTMS